MIRRTIIVCMLLVVGVVFVGNAQEFDWRQFEGTTIVVNFPAHSSYKAAMTLIPEFEEATGIKVEVDELNYMRMHEKQVLEMSKPVGDYDAISLVCMWKTEYVEGDMLTELEPFFADPKLVYPDYDFDDLVPAYVDNTGRVGGKKIYLGGPGSKLYAIPLGAETSVLAYRKDLFEQYNIKVPETYDEVRAAAKFFAEEVDGVYGLTMRGASGHHATHAWLLHADPFGAKVFDENWEPAFTSQEAIDTLNFMKEMVTYGPPGIPGFTYDNQNNAFTEGLAAMYIDGIAISGRVNDPKISKVVGKVGYTLHPKQKTRLSFTGGFGVGIPANASNKEAAFLFIQWLTTKDADKKIVLAGGAPSRMSTLTDAELQEKHPEYKVLAEQLPHADPDWRPITKEWGEINAQLLGVAISQALTGEKTPEEAMASIVEPVRAIMERGGYYKK